MKKKQILKTPSGTLVENDNASQSIQNSKTNGYILLQDNYLINKLAHFNRERVPERVVHAKGAGAHGYFTLNKNMGKYTDAKIFNEINKKIPLFIRFSTVGGESGTADAARDPRGFAIKFYTEEGNYDIVGNNTPIFFIRDAIKFPDFIHTQKRHPQTNLKDANMMWDFWSLTPESLHQIMFLFSERGVPKNYREMHGYGSHTFMWYKKNGNYVWVKYHFKSTLGFNGMTNYEALEMTKNDPDHATRDLFEAIEKKNFPKWTVQVQIMTKEQAKEQILDPFDVTKVWSHKKFPLIEIGEIILEKNPINYFAEVEQVAFSPANFIPGVGPSPDKLLQGRLFAYGDAHRHRIGPNNEQLKINKPLGCPYSNQRGGYMANAETYGSNNNYYPSTQLDAPIIETYQMPIIKFEDAWISREFNQNYEADYVQPKDFYKNVLTKVQQTELINNLVASLSNVNLKLKYRQTTLFYKVDSNFGQKIGKKLNLDLNKIKDLSKLSHDKLVEKTLLTK